MVVPSPAAKEVSTVKSQSPSRPTTPGSMSSPAGVTRTRSVRGAGSPATRGTTRGGRGASAINRSSRSLDEENKAAEIAQALDDLRSQLRDAETKRDDSERDNWVLKSRLEDAMADHARVEDTSNEQAEKLEALTKEIQDATRKYKELENIFENEKAASLKEREDAHNREEELNEIVQRLKDSLANRDSRKGSDVGEGLLSRSGSFRGRSSPKAEAVSPSLQARDSSQNSSKLVLQKDKVIESLRLELAEAQIKLVEMENKGGSHVQDLEKLLLEARMSNAKLMEDNESYQVLLSEKTLNGDMAKSSLLEPPKSPGVRSVSMTGSQTSNLADELSGVREEGDGEQDPEMRRLEAELDYHKDQNKALTLYINKIIGRLLATEQFEHLFQDGADEDPLKEGAVSKDKQLPPLPGAADGAGASNGDSTAPSLLQRAGSLFGRKGATARPAGLTERLASASMVRPDSQSSAGSPPQTANSEGNLTLPNPDPLRVQKRLSANEDPNLAPSLPIRRTASTNRRSHRRSNSDWSASVVNQMYRGPSGSSVQSGPLSPSIGSQPHRSSFQAAQAPATPLIREDGDEKKHSDEIEDTQPQRSDVASDSGYADSVAGSDRPPSPRSAASAALEGRPVSGAPAGVAERGWWNREQAAPPTKGGMRPLRLVQEKEEAEEAAIAATKKANRSSILSGWFSKTEDGHVAQSSPERK